MNQDPQRGALPLLGNPHPIGVHVNSIQFGAASTGKTSFALIHNVRLDHDAVSVDSESLIIGVSHSPNNGAFFPPAARTSAVAE
jgi:hypothetical protein